MRRGGVGGVGSVGLGLLVGALCAVAIACGGAPKAAMAPSATGEAPSPAPGILAPGDARAELDQLSAKIDTDLGAMGLSRPVVPLSACIQPPCGAEALSTAVPVSHAADPACRPGAGEVCRDSCRLSDSICDSSGRICRIASELGGGDAYANEKCAGGKASCEAARSRCCGCL